VPPSKPRRRGAMTGLVGLMGGVATPSRSLEQAPVIQNVPTPLPVLPKDSLPEIGLSIGSLGRESLDALEREFALDDEGSIPEVHIGEGAALGRDSIAAIDRELRGSMPDILVGEGRLGAASLAAIEASARLRVGSTPDVRLELASLSRASAAELSRIEAESAERDIWRPDPTTAPSSRLTNPWSEAAVDSQRAVEAQRRARAVQPPRVSLKLETMDESVMEAALVEELESHVAARLASPMPLVSPRPKTEPPPAALRTKTSAPPKRKTTPPPLPPLPAFPVKMKTMAPPPMQPRPKTTPPPLPTRSKTPPPLPKRSKTPPPLPPSRPVDDAPSIETNFDPHRPPQSSYEAWADAVDEITTASKKTKRR
jgi:hypothetical protein